MTAAAAMNRALLIPAFLPLPFPVFSMPPVC
jgi:hypothetical protein